MSGGDKDTWIELTWGASSENKGDVITVLKAYAAAVQFYMAASITPFTWGKKKETILSKRWLNTQEIVVYDKTLSFLFNI